MRGEPTQPEGREVVLPVGLGGQQEVEEGGRCRQQLGPVPLNRRADRLGGAAVRDDEGSAVGQGVQQGDGAPAGTGPPELGQQQAGIVHDSLALARGAGGEEDQAGAAALAQRGEQRVVGGAAGGLQVGGVVGRKADDYLDLGQFRELRLVFRGCGGDGHGGVPIGPEGQQQCGEGGGVLAVQGHDLSGRNGALPEPLPPRRDLCCQPGVGVGPVRPDQGLPLTARGEPFQEPVDADLRHPPGRVLVQ